MRRKNVRSFAGQRSKSTERELGARAGEGGGENFGENGQSINRGVQRKFPGTPGYARNVMGTPREVLSTLQR